MARKWENLELRKINLEKIAKAYNFENYEDWYKLTRKMVLDQNLGELIKYYGQSPYKLMKNNFPEYDWKPWLFENMPRNFWQNKENVVWFFQWLSEQLHIKKLEDWYLIDTNMLQRYGFYQCLYRSLLSMYPEYDWKSWLFSNPPKNMWNDENNLKKYFIWLSEQLNITKNEDWYKITAISLKKHNIGGMLIRKFGHLYDYLKYFVPDYDWKPWLFTMSPNCYWKNKKNHRLYGEWLENVLNIDKIEKWYLVTQYDFADNAGASLLSMHYGGSPAKFVTHVFPEYNLDIKKFKRFRKGQEALYNLVKEIFPNKKVEWEFKHDKIRSKYNRKLELDIFIEEFNLAFEFNGMQHDKPILYFCSRDGFKRIQENDKIKRESCNKLGIKLISVPYRWKKDKNDLIKMLKEKGLELTN